MCFSVFQWGQFVMLIIRNLNLISIQSWAYMEMRKHQFVLKTKRISILIVLFLSISGLHKPSVVYRLQLCQCWQCSERQSQWRGHLVDRFNAVQNSQSKHKTLVSDNTFIGVQNAFSSDKSTSLQLSRLRPRAEGGGRSTILTSVYR